VSEKGCGRVALLSGRTITLAMGVPACPREHHGALGARVSRILSRLRCLDHLTAILIGVGSGVFIIAAGRIFRQIIVVHTASAANRRLVSTADSRYLALILVRLVCTGHDANTLYCTRFLPWSAERNDLLPDLDRSGCISARSTCGYSGMFLALWNGTLRVPLTAASLPLKCRVFGEMRDVLHSRAPLPLIPPAPFSHTGRRGSLGVLIAETGDGTQGPAKKIYPCESVPTRAGCPRADGERTPVYGV
jgi:hypothetical protein